jgi:hypothetical protein
MTTVDPFAPGESVGYFKFDQIGDTATGLVDEIHKFQDTNQKTGKPDVWPNGDPKYSYRIELRNVETGEVMNLFARNQMVSAIRAAGKEAGGIVGKVLKVKYDHDGTPSQAGYRPPKVYKAKVENPPAKVAPRVEPKPVVDDPFGDGLDDSF